MALRDDERVAFVHRMNVEKCENILVLIHLERWKFTLDYFTKDAVRVHEGIITCQVKMLQSLEWTPSKITDARNQIYTKILE